MVLTQKPSLSVKLQARAGHGDRYDYSLVEYVNSETKVDVVCKEHGMFEQSPVAHRLGSGCTACWVLRKGYARLSNTDMFITKASLVHKNKYDYSLVDYTKARKKVIIICSKHGEFEQSSHHHLSGHGCMKCSHELTDISKRMSSDKPHTLYYIKLTNGARSYYKIGVTSKTIAVRFDAEKDWYIEVIESKLFEVGGDAFKAERDFLRKYSWYLTKDKPLHRKGNTEVFDLDVLNLDPVLILHKYIENLNKARK